MKERVVWGNRMMRMLILSVFLLLAAGSMAGRAEAATAGWSQNSAGKISYSYLSDGKLVKATKCFKKIDGYYYYFNSTGYAVTGWVRNTTGGYRYFQPTGALGVQGRMKTGMAKIDGKYYYFKANGVAATGYTKVGNYHYYFSPDAGAGVNGAALVNHWKKIDGYYHWFCSVGRMYWSRWVGSNYYVDSEGRMLRSKWLKLDGKYYRFGSTGKKLTGWQKIGSYKYYFTTAGYRVTGLQKIDGHTYYFSEGKLQINTTCDGYTTDGNGEVISNPSGKKARILIVAGHGQGDAGATSILGKEAEKTREFASLIYSNLRTYNNLSVEYYKNGSISYDMYQQNVKTFGSQGLNMLSKITGAGTVRSKVISGFATNVNLPNLSNYDYVLEIHFNATATSLKDTKGDGVQKGIGFYINGKKTKYSLESSILNRVHSLGFKIWAGVVKSDTLLNARICQEIGTNYGLLETAFIDDRDDMRFYNNNRAAMAKAVASAIASYF